MDNYKIALRAWDMTQDAVLDGDTLCAVNEDGGRLPLPDCPKLQAYANGEDCLAFRCGGKWGFVNAQTGRITVPPVWDYAGDFHDSHAEVCTGCAAVPEAENGFARPADGKWGLLREDGDLVIPAEYDALWYTGITERDLVIVRMEDRFCCVSIRGEEVLPVIYQELRLYPDSITVKKDGLCGVTDRRAELLLPTMYECVIPVGKERFFCKTPKGRWSFLHCGKTVFDDADTVWCVENRYKDPLGRIFMLAERDGLFTLVCEDGRLLSTPLSMTDVMRLVKNLIGIRLNFIVWLETGKEVLG